MHEIEFTENRVTCNCGWGFDTLTGSEAQWLSYQHAKHNAPAITRDMRFSQKEGE